MNHHLISRLNTLANGAFLSRLSYTEVCREAIAEIERLEAQLKQNNTKHMEVLKRLKGTDYNYNVAVKRINELQAELDSTNDKRFSGYETIHINKDEVIGNDELRDQFACAAMQGMVTRFSGGAEYVVAEQAYRQADAMLKAREKKNA